ncbi:MAG: amino acid adenylation domain-containing protein [Candidatus Acidiferrales bacterium]
MTLQNQTVSLADYLEASALRFPERAAVVNPDGTEISFRDLDTRADRVAAFLTTHGVSPGDRVALLMPKSADTVAIFFGILKARAAYVPVDWTAPSARVQTILDDCDARTVFVDARVLDKLGAAADALNNLIVLGGSIEHTKTTDRSGTTSWGAVLTHNVPPPSRADRTRIDLAYILYTSGSTGIPKGVMLSHGNALSFVDWCSAAFQPHETDRFSSHAPFHFDLSILDLYVPLKHGASVHLIDDETGKNPKELAKFIAHRELTVWYSTPSILHLLASIGNLKRFDYSKLRLVLFAGEVFPVKHLRQLTQYWPAPHYYNLYGPTETNVCTYAPIPSRVPDERTEPYPIGRACSHCAASVLGVDARPVAPGTEGVLYIAGESVFRGYWNRSKETAAAFLLRDGQRWYSTGDVVREDPDQGFIYVGRRDRMVKRRGYRIELDDIESALYRHEQIREAAVTASSPGGAEVKIVAYLVASGEPGPGIVQMKIFCANQLSAYMNPDVFVFLPKLPRTSTDKVDYQSLKRQFEQKFAETFCKS